MLGYKKVFFCGCLRNEEDFESRKTQNRYNTERKEEEEEKTYRTRKHIVTHLINRFQLKDREGYGVAIFSC